MTDLAKIRRESIRWQIIVTLNNSRPVDAHESLILSVVRSIFVDASAVELRRELDYLADRELVELQKKPFGAWFAGLTRLGVDVAEYTVECEPGIARPEKYWDR